MSIKEYPSEIKIGRGKETGLFPSLLLKNIVYK